MRKLIVRPASPEDHFEWQWNPQMPALEHQRLGVRVQLVNMVYEDTGQIRYDDPVLFSKRAEVHVPVRDDGHVGLVRHWRPKVIPPEVLQDFFTVDPKAMPDISLVRGIELYECPHGLTAKAGAEAEEETGFRIMESVQIGFVTEMLSWGGAPHVLYATKLSHRVSGKGPEKDEQIEGIQFFPPEEMKNIQTICALTQASLWRFRCWGLSQNPDSFWYSVAAKF